MKIALFAFGKLKTPGLSEAADYYSKIIRPWVSLEIIELKPLPVPDKSASTRKRIQEDEGETLLARIESRLGSSATFYLLDESGKGRDTLEWSRNVRNWEERGIGQVGFVIGSSLGFSQAVRSAAPGAFSLGPQTLSHELARVVLLEQLYRAWSVVRGHPYHNPGA